MMNRINELLIHVDEPLKEAIDLVNATNHSIAFIINSSKELLGTITDGDIRRSVIKNVSQSTPVKEVMNPKPLFIAEKDNHPEFLKKTFKENPNIMQLPIVDSDNKIIDFVTNKKFHEIINMNKTAVIMAGGLGSRLKELTKNTPKPLLKVSEKPIIEHIYDNLKKIGIKNLFISVNYKADMIIDHFKDLDPTVEYLVEKDKLGTAGSLTLLKPHLKNKDNPIFVINGDVLSPINFNNLLYMHKKNNYDLTLGIKQIHCKVPYGVVDVDKDFNLNKLEEKPNKSVFINSGIYCLNPDVIEHIPENRYYDMTDLINDLKANNKKLGVFPIHEYWIDIGQQQDYQRAQSDYFKVIDKIL